MTLAALPDSNAVTFTPPTGMPRGKRPVQSGLSVLARGEAFVWLTGGMLVVAMGMIVGLLAFVLYRGGSTFWPARLAMFPTLDGNFTAGEIQNSQAFRYDASQIGSLSPKAQDLAKVRLGDTSTATANRVYLRVGNFDLSGEHFAYLNEFEQLTEEPYLPAEAWVVERLHSGRFYGVPGEFTETFRPQGDDSYREIEEVEQLLSTLQGYATEEIPWNDEAATEIASRLTQKKQDVALEYFRRMFDGTPLNDGERWQYESSEGAVQAAEKRDDIPRDATWLRLIATTPESIHLAYRFAAVSVEQFRQRIDTLQEELAHNDALLRDARLHVRQAEIDYDVAILDKVSELEADWVTVRVAEKQLADLAESLAEFDKFAQPTTSQKETITKLFDAMKLETQSQIDAMIASNRQQEQANFAEMEPACMEAVQHYRDVLLDTNVAQIEINEEIAVVEEEVKSAVIRFDSTTPQQPEPITGLNNQSDVNTATLGIAAEQAGWELGPNTNLEFDAIGDAAWWVRASSPSGMRHMMIAKSDDGLVMTKPQSADIEVAEIVRAYLPNQLSLAGKLEVYFGRWSEFLTSNPRDAGMEGGFFPAVWGTVVMTMMMALMVVPFGVLAALYLREYAASGWIVAILRIAINNLAGVPSVVYGVFGLAFFCYVVGGYIDGGPTKAGIEIWPPVTWFIMLGLVAVVSVVAFFLSFTCSGSPMAMGPWKRLGRTISGFVWLLSVAGFIALLAKTPFFGGFYEANLPNPTFGKGGLIWASLTLALLTLPVVIVATEEALSAVPNSLREGSYACGAGKWQTIQRIVLPHARPGIMTGAILAMARGAGEVAPMMLVGALPLAIDLPLDTEFPFFHGSRSFMHLGFQIYALGFQGQNSEAAKPMVFTTTLLLILIVLALNLIAIVLRARLKKRFQGVQF